MLLRILVCYYKEVIFKPLNKVYYPIQCGAESTLIDLEMQKDNEGDNISVRNQYWSEITGLYWAWKNLNESKYVGLCSYRRFFNFKKSDEPIKIIPISRAQEINSIDIPEIDDIFESYDIILPTRYTYAYNFDKVCQMNYNVKDFNILKDLIKEISPEYIDAYDHVYYKSNKQIGHNMFIMKWDNYQEYCEWVFKILLAAEKKINPENYPINQIRVYGYMHEILLDVYVVHKKFKPYYSQLTWITDNSKGFKFNSLFYRFLANLYYAITKRRQ